MSNLTKSYEISVWEEKIINGQPTEERICIIGSDELLTQSRAISPKLVRNTNGTKTLSFKMYKRYVDLVTGLEVENPFTSLLVAERKVKLKYKNKWYDFVIKSISETSTEYLLQYVLEDALVQELSKNGFGVILDAELMNNVGDAAELAKTVLEETDWDVSSETFVETIDESLIYIEIPGGTKATLVKDQRIEDYNSGVDDSSFKTFDKNTLVLAFYSSCKNKPHRFQFIYCEQGYNKDSNGAYKIKRKDNKIIEETDCQYYIDFDNPEEVYKYSDDGGLDLYLPEGYSLGVPAQKDGDKLDKDTYLSSWYMGKKYSFAQQSTYVPLLERYCQNFKRNYSIDLTAGQNIDLYSETDGDITWDVSKNQKISSFFGTKSGMWSGYKVSLDFDSVPTYVLSYSITIRDGSLVTIGGHNKSFYTDMQIIDGDNIYHTNTDTYTFFSPIKNKTIDVIIKYNKINNDNGNIPASLYIQPNCGVEDYVEYEIKNLKLEFLEDYLGYTETEFISPTLVQNCINDYKFESGGGWTAASAKANESSDKKNQVQNVYGRFSPAFSSISEDFLKGEYSEGYKYAPYMHMKFFNTDQFVLNSSIMDNRTTIGNMSKGEEWVLDCTILNRFGVDVTGLFDFSLGEYVYNVNTSAYIPRMGFIGFDKKMSYELTPKELLGKPNDGLRYIFTVANSTYDKETFKKNSKVQLQIKPLRITSQDGEEFYIKKISLYKKSWGSNGQIIVPDSDESIENFEETGILESKYYYFSKWYVDANNTNKITNKDSLPVEVKTNLEYSLYKPVYNEGAKKVRAIEAKESNYFNILQNIAETFGAWVELEVVRDEDSGKIKKKIVNFKNYIGKNNYAGFRYGVNLNDIQRTINSKQIVTKLIVKSNNNELGKNGMCTIQRANTNPTGENYLYDFQYYQNTGIMDANDYLNTVYYIDGAKGEDAELWKGQVLPSEDYNLNGYYSRIKKINDTLLPITEEISGLNIDLLRKQSQLEVEEATYEASTQGIEQVREDFRALTGVYPEEAQEDQTISIRELEPWEMIDLGISTVVPQDNWWSVYSLSMQDNIANITLKVDKTQQDERGYTVEESQGITTLPTNAQSKKFTKNSPYTGLYISNPWEEDINRVYTLTYEIEAIEGKLKNIGCHNAYFQKAFKITVKNQQGQEIANSTSSVCNLNAALNTRYYVTVTGTRKTPSNTNNDQNLWIQPNRGLSDSVTCIVSNIKLYKTLTEEESTKAEDRVAHFSLNLFVKIKGQDNEILRTYNNLSCVVPANKTLARTQQKITAVDTSRSDVQKYITEYTTYYEKRSNAYNEKEALKKSILNKKTSIQKKNEQKEQILAYKKKLNYLFFKKYYKFIQEGTWIDESYIDDNKYYADAQSVLYDSCYPQITYSINVLDISSLPGYENLEFELGDKTFVIDENFFGPDYREEVVITETTEELDDPSKSTIKVQTFKNQFQDLFQKITATVQTTQYNAGSYEKGAALVEANAAKQNEFVVNAINNAQSYLNHGQTVVTGPDGITITDNSDRQNQLRMVGGAILFRTTDPKTKQQTWMTGITKDGISANLITAGKLDVGQIQIMSGNDPVFRWDMFGISAYDALWTEGEGFTSVSGINTRKFVRFDKNGIYGINNAAGIDGANWHPNGIHQIDENATFALTWEGLKVTQKYNVGTEENPDWKYATARIGNYTYEDGKDASNNPIIKNSIIKINDGIKDTFLVSSDGCITMEGIITATGGSIGGFNIGGFNFLGGVKRPSLYYGVVDGAVGTDSGTFVICPDGAWLPKFETGTDEGDRWLILAGNNFGLTQSGALYATSGKIGPITISSNALGVEGVTGFTSTYITSGTITTNAISTSAIEFDSYSRQARSNAIDQGWGGANIWFSASSAGDEINTFYVVSIGDAGIVLWTSVDNGKYQRTKTVSWKTFFSKMGV